MTNTPTIPPIVTVLIAPLFAAHGSRRDSINPMAERLSVLGDVGFVLRDDFWAREPAGRGGGTDRQSPSEKGPRKKTRHLDIEPLAARRARRLMQLGETGGPCVHPASRGHFLLSLILSGSGRAGLEGRWRPARDRLCGLRNVA